LLTAYSLSLPPHPDMKALIVIMAVLLLVFGILAVFKDRLFK
jgi:hypothetical protein